SPMQQPIIVKIARVESTPSKRKLVAGSLELVQPIIEKIPHRDSVVGRVNRTRPGLFVPVEGTETPASEIEEGKKGRIVQRTTSVELRIEECFDK
ncbi:hypothetical protein K0M31_014241, partial [Melipona bicolor]